MEKVKLDIAVNGQDFKGGFDFYITQELIIHRTVPMAGPVQGLSRTRIIGQGFKPRSRNVDLKWGVLETAIVHREEVTEYIYQQIAFENMIEGSEELKSYIYEASNYQRVDTTLYENYTYHSIYMNNPKMWNWTRTHGGPYYVEVGNNVKIEYIDKEKAMVNSG